MKTDLVVAGYLVHEGKVLLIHHRELDRWLPVGGHIDEGEMPEEALKREFMEEVGLDVEVLGKSKVPMTPGVIRHPPMPFHVNVHSVGDHNHYCFYYVCRLAGSREVKKADREIIDYMWFSEEGLKENSINEDVRAMGILALSH